MKARDKYLEIFGPLIPLDEPASWSMGVSNMFEWLTWTSEAILGVSKTRYRTKIVEWCHEMAAKRLPLGDLQSRIEQNIKRETTISEVEKR